MYIHINTPKSTAHLSPNLVFNLVVLLRCSKFVYHISQEQTTDLLNAVMRILYQRFCSSEFNDSDSATILMSIVIFLEI